MKFRVLRNLWLRGEGPADSFLKRKSDGKQCCLGFFAEACGVKTEALTGYQAPCGLWEADRNLMPAWLFPEQSVRRSLGSNAGAKLMDLNDDQIISDTYREEQLTARFAEQGVEVEFV